MRRLLCLLLLACAPALASDVILEWDQPTGGADPTSYTIYVGTAPGVYGPGITGLPYDPGLVHQTHTFADGSLTQDARNYVVIAAVNASGESGPSVEISGYPRPTITGTPVPVQDVGFVRLTIDGHNFSDGISTADIALAGMTVISVNRVDATQIIIDYTIDPGTPDVPAAMTISNQWNDTAASWVASMQSAVVMIPSLVPLVPVPFDIH